MKNCYCPKAKAIIHLQELGYDHDFVLKNENIVCIQDPELISPDDFEITEVYRFDGQTRLADNYLICAIKLLNNDLRGILMTSYARLTEGVSIHLWSKLADCLN